MGKRLSKKHTHLLATLKETPAEAKFDLHYWADFLELRCLFNFDGLFTISDFLDSFNDNLDFRPKDFFDDAEYEDDSNETVSAAEKNDLNEKFVLDCFKLLRSRSGVFKEYYPFYLSKDNKTIYRKKNLTWKNRCYIFLLFSACLNYFRDYTSLLTSCFEVFGLSILKQMLPKNAEVHFFGSGNSILKGLRYTGHIWTKIEKLKSDLNESFIKAQKGDFPPTSSGDAGFDFVAWIGNGDNQSHMLAFTGQAACTDKWITKKYSSSSSALSALIPVSVPPVNIVFIPFSFRNVDGLWQRTHVIGDCVLLDRQRLLFHLNSNRSSYINLPCDNQILELINLRDYFLN